MQLKSPARIKGFLEYIYMDIDFQRNNDFEFCFVFRRGHICLLYGKFGYSRKRLLLILYH